MDEQAGQLRIVGALGLTQEEIDRGRYALGEGITGRVVQTGEARIVPDIAGEPEFLNRTRARPTREDGGTLSFICLPILLEGKPVGALSVDKAFTDRETLEADRRLLTIVASIIAQAIKINRLVAQEKEQLVSENSRLRDELRAKYKFVNVIGSSPAMLEVFDTIALVAPSKATVLIQGETGTGKELIARAIHYNSPRAAEPFVRVNCGALAGTLLESELFGHIKGAFTNAFRDKIGRFEAADGGTIFLDEIGTLDQTLQVKLLRVLQEREFERVGDHRTVKVDVRVIAATHVDLQMAVAENRFREDLFYRLNVVTIMLPALRERKEDIPRLIDFFLDNYNRQNSKSLHRISRELLDLFLRYPWPGNVRELENCVERAVVLSRGDVLTENLLPTPLKAFAQSARPKTDGESAENLARALVGKVWDKLDNPMGEVHGVVVDLVEKVLIERALAECRNNKSKAAEMLGINRNTLGKKLREGTTAPRL
jgi:Nif-specific regulatory protein